ncbi:unnamed protein product [Arctogadus glacialis]
MKKFSRLPRSESGGPGGSGTSSSYSGKVFAVGRYQVTVEELIAEAGRNAGATQCSLYDRDRVFVLNKASSIHLPPLYSSKPSHYWPITERRLAK